MTGGKIQVIMAGWKWLVFDGAISHMVPEELVDVIVKDLTERGCPLIEQTERPTFYLDRPGMIYTTRPHEEFTLRDLDIEVPCEDLGPLMGNLAELPLRAGCYYKLHGFHRCIVLTQALRDEMLQMMQELYPHAEAKAHEFYATRPTPSEALRDVAAKQMGVKRENIPNLGANGQDRFRAKGSGSLPN